MWTRARTIIAGQAKPDDWTVLWCGQACGRVYRAFSPVTDSRTVWNWAAHCYPGSSGQADTLAEALSAVREAVIAAGGRMSGGVGDLVM